MSKVSQLALLGALAMFGVGQAASPAAASALGIDITNTGLTFGNSQLFSADEETGGYQFAVNGQPVQVTALGVFDNGNIANLDLSGGPTFVQLWTAGGAALSGPVSVTASNYFQDGLFAFVTVAPISLAANTNYIVGSEGFGEFALRLNPSDYTVNPYITYVEDQYDTTFGALTFPESSTDSEVGIFGGNVELVPEPMSLSLFGFGLAGLGLLRRRKRA